MGTGKISEKLDFKRHRLLRAIRRDGPVGRLQLARHLRMSNSRVCDFIQEMLDANLLIEDHTGPERRGRRAVPLRVNGQYGTLLGFDMEASRLRLIAQDFAGLLIWQKERHLDASLDRAGLLDALLGFIESGLADVRRKHPPVLGIGLAGAGILDPARGVILHYHMLPAARDLPLRDLVATRTSLPCVLERNTNTLALAEGLDGAAQGLDTYVCLAVRSGIGAGVVLDGRLYTGTNGLAGETGYAVIPGSGSAENWPSLQDLASQRAMTGEDGQPTATPGARHKAGCLLGAHLASLAALLDPQAFVLAGDLVQPGGALYEPMIRTYRQRVLPELAERVAIHSTGLGPMGPAIGAAHRCFQHLYPVGPDG